MRLELAYPTTTIAGNPTPYNLSRTTPTWFSVLDSEIKGLEDLQMQSLKEDGNQQKKTMSGDLIFYDNTKDLLLNAFYVSSSPVGYMWVRIYDCECNLYIFTGQITRDKIEFCSQDCFLRCRATEYDEVTDAYNSLNNVLNYGAYKSDTSEHVLNFLVRNGDTETGASHYQESVRVGGLLKNSIQSLPEFVFQSSILNSPTGLNGWTGDYYSNDMGNVFAGYVFVDRNPYFYTYIVNADISKGQKLPLVGNFLRPEHFYVRTIKDFLNEQKILYNADYIVKKVGSQVHFIFERRDYFFQSSVIWKDCTLYNTCFEIDNRNQYAYADLRYNTVANISDASDYAFEATLNNNIEEWNNPVSPIQKDAYSVFTQYSYAPTYEDSVGGRSDGGIGLRPPYTTSTPIIAIPGTFIAGFNIFEQLGIYNTTTYTAVLYDYNTPMYFGGDVASAYSEYTGLPANTGSFSSVFSYYRNCNLYDCFHFIENPRNATNHLGYTSKYSKKYLRFTVEVEFTCEEFIAFDSDSAVTIDVLGTPTKGMIESVDWDFKKRTCIIKGLI